MSQSPKTYALLAGEVSGDNLGASLMASLKTQSPEASFWGVGGEAMLERGLAPLFPMADISVMGIIEPLKTLPKLIKRKNLMVQTILQREPNIFIGIDSPDFNLRVARDIKANNPDIKVAHYVSPSVWAWRQHRILGIKASVDLMITLFPFESAFYDHHNVPNICVGHPMAEQLPIEFDRINVRQSLGLYPHLPTIALLPGSRKSEVDKLLPLYLESAKKITAQLGTGNCQFVLPIAQPSLRSLIESIVSQYDGVTVHLYENQSSALLQASDSALVTSGTATLEAMLCQCPMVVGYKTSSLTYQIAKRMVKSEHIAIPNLLAKARIVPELIQQDCTPEKLANEALNQLNHPEKLDALRARFAALHRSLQLGGSEKAAASILQLTENT